ncbi:YbaN family protein [Defluviimonas salinarum]|uniref:YbaN family protein n=1 Tax=Defluviimonas salinarum TaxID=2992147 RepID=A0ABT3J1X9_9RHOB|nr:YbaN family protein [Defluviimonas salinarum]
MRPIWLLAGGAALALAAAGIVLPLVPTVPFLLLAAFCFARGSERMHGWLVAHHQFGPPIRDWQERGAVSRRVKWIASASIAAALCLAAAFRLPLGLLAVQAVVLCGVLLFLWTRPEA